MTEVAVKHSRLDRHRQRSNRINTRVSNATDRRGAVFSVALRSKGELRLLTWYSVRSSRSLSYSRLKLARQSRIVNSFVSSLTTDDNDNNDRISTAKYGRVQQKPERVLSLDLKTDRESLTKTVCGSEFQTDRLASVARTAWCEDISARLQQRTRQYTSINVSSRSALLVKVKVAHLI